MDTALIIVIAAVALLVILFAGRRAWRRGLDARREKASELRVEATRRQERARRAEVEAEREREAAEVRSTRAERIDPDTEGGAGRLRRFRRDRDEDVDEDDRDYGDAEGGERSRPSLWNRLVHR
jgi:FtsZ-interacting cell division protein ZipA